MHTRTLLMSYLMAGALAESSPPPPLDIAALARTVWGRLPRPQTSDQTPGDSEGNRCLPRGRVWFPCHKVLYTGVTCVKWIAPYF